MPRPPRADEAGAIYHALNRANARETIFLKEGDYEAYERIIVEGLERVNDPLDSKVDQHLRRCIRRSSPFGEQGWVESTARRLNLESTIRPKGRPRKFPQSAK